MSVLSQHGPLSSPHLDLFVLPGDLSPDLLALVVGQGDLLEHELCPWVGADLGPLQVVQIHPLVLLGPVDVPQPKVDQAQPDPVPSFNKDIGGGEVVGMEDADSTLLASEVSQVYVSQ